MKSLIAIVLGLSLLAACSSPSPLCTEITSVSTTIATAISAQCGCDEAAVESSIFPLVNIAGMCTVSGPVADVVCPLAGQQLASLLGSAFPSSWKCTAAAACVGVVLAPAVAACEAIPFAPAPKPSNK